MQITTNLKESGTRTEQIKQLAEGMARPKAMLEEIGLYLLSSIKRNFMEGGRPVRWKPSKRAIRENGMTLIDTGNLMNSISTKVEDRILKIGTDKKYAAIQNFGGTIAKEVKVQQHWRVINQAFGQPIPSRPVKVKAHSRNMRVTIAPRPFLMIQDEDWRVIERIGHDFMLPDPTTTV